MADLVFSEALRVAMAARGLALERVAAHLQASGHPVSIATLSYWQSGRSVPARAQSFRALGALETILQVPRGHLARLVPAPAGEGQDDQARPAFADIMRQRAAIDDVQRTLGRGFDAGIERLISHTRARADQSGDVPSVLCREVLRADEDGLDGYLASAGHPLTGIDVVITPLFGCAIRTAVAERSDSICVAHLALPRLRRGSVHVLEYEIGFHGLPALAQERAQAMLYFVSGVRELYLQVEFQPDAAPAEVTLIEGIGAQESRTRHRVTRPTLSLARSYAGPCRVGFTWSTGELGAVPSQPAQGVRCHLT